MKINKKRGFTLIEILVVIGIIAILAAVVLIAINPARQFAQARDSQRTANLNAILNAVGQRIADNKGTFEGSYVVGATTYNCPNLTTSGTNPLTVDVYYNIDKAASTLTGTTIGMACLAPRYIPAFPTDPKYVSGNDTLYNLKIDSSGRISVQALAEIDQDNDGDVDANDVITVTR